MGTGCWSSSEHGRMKRMKIDIDDFLARSRAEEKHFALFLSDSPFFNISWFPDTVSVAHHLWCYLSDNLQLGHDCKHWRAIVTFPVIFEKHSSRPLWLFLWLAFASIYKFSSCFITQDSVSSRKHVEGQIKDGNTGWKSTGVLWPVLDRMNIFSLIRTWLRYVWGAHQNLHSG